MTIDRPDLIGPETYLETIVDMGYTATETGPPGYFAPNGAAAVEKAGRFGVELIATFLPLRLDDADGFDGGPEARSTGRSRCSRRRAAASCCWPTWRRRSAREPPAATSGAARPAGTRRPSTGPPSGCCTRPASSRAAGSTSRCTRTPRRTSSRRRRLEQLLERAPGLGLCIDTGHTIVGGGDPLALAQRHLDRIRHLHLKDVDGARARAAAGGRGRHGRGVAAGDLLRVRRRRRAAAGDSSRCPRCRALDVWAVIEQDRVAVTVDDMPVVRAADERNRARVEDWLR